MDDMAKKSCRLLLVALAVTGATALDSAQQPPAGVAPAPPPAARVPPVLQGYQSVTADRLKKPEDGDWLMTRRTYDGWGYSPLTQITSGNAARLQPVWVVATGVNNGHEAAPIV